MTSLNTRTGWDANKQTGSNLTHSAAGGGSKSGAQENSKVISSLREGSGSEIATSTTVNVTPTTPVPSSSLITKDENGRTIIAGFNDTKTITDNYFRQYDPMTGVRIASTLGGFFLLVLLTLLYKSKCKGKHSREPSNLSLNQPMTYPIHPGHLIMRGRNVQVNGRPDFSGGGGGRDGCDGFCDNYGGGGEEGDDSGPALPMSLTLLDSTCYGYMNQIHPANSRQPIYSNYCVASSSSAGPEQVKSPAVLLITSANSESSDEELSVISTTEHHHHNNFGQEGCSGYSKVSPVYVKGKDRNPLGAVQSSNMPISAAGSVRDPTSQYFLHPRTKSPPLRGVSAGKGNIDINVILPTPSVSPSGSENFNVGSNSGGHYCRREQHHHCQTITLYPKGNGGGGGVSGNNNQNGRIFIHSRSLSSDNENDNSEVSCCGEGGVGDLSECEAPMLPFGCANSSLFSLENLKYVDDTSSENIPTRASDGEEQDHADDTRSIGSDSVFACFEHNFDHIAPTYARRVSSVSGTSSGVLGGASPQAPHHPFSYNQSLNNNNAQPSSSGTMRTDAVKASGFAEEDESEFRVTLTAHAQVHHRDSFCSDLESVNDYMETGARRRSSSTQTTLSDLRQALGYSPTTAGGWTGGGFSPGTGSLTSYSISHENNNNNNNSNNPRRLSVPRRRRSLSPHMNPSTLQGFGGPPQPNQTASHSLSNSTSPLLSVRLHPATTTTSSSSPPTLFLTEGGGISNNSSSGGVGSGSGEKGTDSSLQTPTNPPAMLLSLSHASTETSPPFIPPSSRLMRKRSSEAIRKTLSLQCEEKGDVASLYVNTSSNETTPTN